MNADHPGGRLQWLPTVYARKGLWAILIISLGWTVAIVVAPLTIAPGTVVGLNGGANRIDHSDLWSELPPMQGTIYLLGDIECHQIASRTIFINGNEMPVCARDASLFFFLTLGFLIASVVKPEVYVSKAVIRLLPAKMQARLEKGSRSVVFTWVVGMLCLMPLAVDGGLQLATPYESTNGVRFLTGIPAGVIVGLVLGLMIQSIHMLASSRRSAEPHVRRPE